MAAIIYAIWLALKMFKITVYLTVVMILLQTRNKHENNEEKKNIFLKSYVSNLFTRLFGDDNVTKNETKHFTEMFTVTFM